ncbi:MAG: topA [Rickettsiales bacterium]|jgi:DNA topoisomerase-1|nr:topA [Rickettsiales bacterium]
MHVVIVESPAKAKTINKYLGNNYKVLASFGHIRDLPAKNGSVRPDEDFAMDYEISDGSFKHVKAIADAVKGADTVFLATDPDREGEAISWHIVEALRERKALGKSTKVQRVSFNEITKRAVQYAIDNPRDIDMDLVQAQQARRALDYLVGFTLSPVLWRKLPGSRSAGRVQSVALRLICEREEEIERFISREYWDIKLDLLNKEKAPFTARLTHVEGKKLDQFDLNNEASATAIAAALKTRQYRVTEVEKKQAQRNPYAPFTTSSLQQEAARKLGFGAKRTMTLAQKLYEGVDIGGETVGLITYMRTDGVTVAQEAIDATRKMIGGRFGEQYLPEKQRVYKTKAKNAQEAHEAIRPTDVFKTPEGIKAHVDQDQFRLYELIWKRMVASQMENAVLNQVGVTIDTTDGYASVRATGSTIHFDGFLTLYIEGRDDADADDDDRILPPLEQGEMVACKAVEPHQHFTQPPPRYTEASLVKKMEELGIGRPSTYASIISVLQDRNYVVLDKKRFVPEERGRIVTAFLVSFFRRYVQYDFTAQLEDQLDGVSAGEIDWKAVLREFWKDFIANIEEVKERDIADILEALELLLGRHLFPADENGQVHRECPTCKGQGKEGKLSLKLGRFGAFIGCSNYPDCNYTRQIGDQGEEGGGDVAGPAEPKILGTDKATGLDIVLKKGPYGFYIQLGEEAKEKEKGKTKTKPKRVSIKAPYTPESLTLEQATSLLSLPREVGTHPETGKVIKASIGPYGPYLLHDGVYSSLGKEDDVLTIGINRAVIVIAEVAARKAAKGEKGAGSSAAPIRVLGNHPDDNTSIGVYSGRYGAYVKHGKINATLPKDESPDSITLEKALELIAAKGGKGGAKKGKGKAKAASADGEAKPKKKPAAKKAAAKKPKKSS